MYILNLIFALMLQLIFSMNFFLLLLLVVFFYHFLIYFLRDKKYIKKYMVREHQNRVNLEDLIEIPLVNIIIPAWKEGDPFRACLKSIVDLSYPKIKVIVNVGGNDETIKIAHSFKKYDNFKIIYQKSGEGKIKAINDCLNHISKGIVYLIDADIILTDNILISMLFILLNKNEDIVVSKIIPHKSILDNDLVKFIHINRYIRLRHKWPGYLKRVSQTTAMKYNIIQSINKFTEKRKLDDGHSIGLDLIEHDFRIYSLYEINVEAFNYSTKLSNYIDQNIRWIENALYYYLKDRKLLVLKFLGLVILSIYVYTSPFLFVLSYYFPFYGFIIFLSFYLKIVRKIFIFKVIYKKSPIRFHPLFFLKLIFYILINFLINIIVFFEMIFYRKAYKKRKNLFKA